MSRGTLKYSISDPGCLSRIPDPGSQIPDPRSRIPDPGSQIPDPDFYPSRIPDVGSKNSNKREGWKIFFYIPFNVATNFTKLNFEVLKKKIWPNFQRIIALFTQKIVTKLLKIWVWDPGSEIRDPGSGKNLFRIPDPGVKKASDPGSRIRIPDPDPQHCLNTSKKGEGYFFLYMAYTCVTSVIMFTQSEFFF